MTKDALSKANSLTQEINRLRFYRDAIATGAVFHKTNYANLPEAVLDAGKSAMFAVIDEMIDASEAEIGAL